MSFPLGQRRFNPSPQRGPDTHADLQVILVWRLLHGSWTGQDIYGNMYRLKGRVRLGRLRIRSLIEPVYIPPYATFSETSRDAEEMGDDSHSSEDNSIDRYNPSTASAPQDEAHETQGHDALQPEGGEHQGAEQSGPRDTSLG